jgi:hypothetical protein
MLNTVTSYTKEKKGVKDSHACQVSSKKETKAAKFTVPGTGRVFNNWSSQFSSTPYARKRERPRKVIKTALVPAYQSGIPSNSSRASTLAVDVRRPGP